jgi:hypothetical protein
MQKTTKTGDYRKIFAQPSYFFPKNTRTPPSHTRTFMGLYVITKDEDKTQYQRISFIERKAQLALENQVTL